MTDIFISTKKIGTVTLTDADTSLILIKDVLLKSSTTGILATGDAINRKVVVDGDISAGDAGIVFVAGAATDINAAIVVSAGGSLTAGRAGISAVANGMDVDNGGTIQAKLTGVLVSGAQTKIMNDGTITSLGSNALDVRGISATVVNTGRLAGQTDTLKSSGDFAVIKNNGNIGSATANGIVATGAEAIISNGGSIGTRGNGIVASGASDTITNSGKIGSGGSAIIAKGRDTIVTNSGTLNAGSAGIVLYGDGGTVTNKKIIEVGGSALIINADDATVINTGTVKGATGIDISGTGVTGANSGAITGWKGSALDLTTRQTRPSKTAVRWPQPPGWPSRAVLARSHSPTPAPSRAMSISAAATIRSMVAAVSSWAMLQVARATTPISSATRRP